MMCKLTLVFSLLKADPDHVFPKLTPQIIPLILKSLQEDMCLVSF